jgi:hypothetical protein
MGKIDGRKKEMRRNDMKRDRKQYGKDIAHLFSHNFMWSTKDNSFYGKYVHCMKRH